MFFQLDALVLKFPLLIDKLLFFFRIVFVQARQLNNKGAQLLNDRI